MDENAVVLISRGSMFLVNNVRDKLTESGYYVMDAAPTVEELSEYRHEANNFILYLGDYIEECKNAIIFLKDSIIEDENNLYVIGSPDEINQFYKIAPKSCVRKALTRPLNVKDLIAVMEDDSLEADRKKTILAGVVMLGVAFGVASFLRANSPTLLMNCMFALAGIGWATINVNSFPMVVELCSGGDVGKYTGFYYTASMAAQVVTPMFSGYLMDRLGMTVLFPYATVFVALAFVTMLFVRHGDSRPVAARGLEALDVDD